LGQCVQGVCSACDAADSGAGCSNPTPICLPNNTCVGCDGENECPAGLTCEDGACYGCVVGTNEGCSPDGTTPICAPASGGRFECVGCTDDNDCDGNRNGEQCVAAGSCEECDRNNGM